MTENIIRISKRPRLRNPYFICAWPGMGEVAFKAVHYLVEQLHAEEFGQVAPEHFFYLTASVVQNGILRAPELPSNKFYFWKNKAGSRDIIIFLSNAQPDLAKVEEYAGCIIAMAKSFHVKTIVSFASMPQAIDHAQEPAVWFTATSAQLNAELQKFGLNLLTEGQISGMNGLFLGLAKKEGLDGFCLLADIPLYTIQIENPKASLAVLRVFSKITGVVMDFAGLNEQAHTIDEEINKLLDYLKLDYTASPIGDEDIERIKKSLTQLTKLPESIKEKINRLFNDSQKDLKRAQELKAELDKWNVYKEYEDRFLDLFKKSEGAGN